MKQAKFTRRTPKQWQEIIKNQEESGLTAAAYCREQGLCKHGFYGWRKQLAITNKSSKNGFVEIKPQLSSVPQVIHVETPKGFRLTFPQGADTKSIRNIIASLEQA